MDPTARFSLNGLVAHSRVKTQSRVSSLMLLLPTAYSSFSLVLLSPCLTSISQSNLVDAKRNRYPQAADSRVPHSLLAHDFKHASPLLISARHEMILLLSTRQDIGEDLARKSIDRPSRCSLHLKEKKGDEKRKEGERDESRHWDL